jgi:hypothetical protein
MKRTAKRRLWGRRVEQYRTSGMSQAAWCRAYRVSVHQLRYWLARVELASEGPSDAEAPASTPWLSLQVEAEPVPAAAGLVIRNGSLVVEVWPECDRSLLLDVVKALQTPC